MRRLIQLLPLALLSIFLLSYFLIRYRTSGNLEICTLQNTDGTISCYARIPTSSGDLTVHAFHREGDDFCLFLPTHVAGMRLHLIGSAMNKADLSSHTVLSESMDLTLSDGRILHLMIGSDVPSLFFELKHDLSYLLADKTNRDTGRLTILEADGAISYRNPISEIHGRGNTSWELDKKPFHVEVPKPVALCDIAIETDRYSLVSSYDDTFLRNRISQRLMAGIGGTSFPLRLVQVYINGSFEGLYELAPQITVTSLNALNDRLSCDYLIEADSAVHYAEEPHGFTTDSGSLFIIDDPKKISADDIETIAHQFRLTEAAMISAVEQNDFHTFSDHIDIDSFVQKYMIEEISKNIDNAVSSQFFCMDKETGRLYAMPAWDYDHAYGTSIEREDLDFLSPEGSVVNYAPGTFKWWQILYYNNAFRSELITLYTAKASSCLEQIAKEELSIWASDVKDSATMDALRWDQTPGLNAADAERLYLQRCDRLREWIALRRENLQIFFSRDS